MKSAVDLNNIVKIGDYLKYLTLMSIQKANSGHPGLPLGVANIGVLLYAYFVKGSSENPTWVNRDRFVLSAGHGSMLLYALNYLFGYDISLTDLSAFRQLGSKTPGHPEYDLEQGIETTTGPLGQGFTNSVGIAIEGKMLQSRFNIKEGSEKFDLFNYRVFTLMGDGCQMEGISYEAASIAGHLGLDNLIALYDDNDISIDGSTDITFSEDVAKRYEALGWEVKSVDGENLQDFVNTFSKLLEQKGKPKLLIVKTTIGEGLNKLKGSHKVHGNPPGKEEIAYFIKHSSLWDQVKKEIKDESSDVLLNWIDQQLETGKFLSKEYHQAFLDSLVKSREEEHLSWLKQFSDYKTKHQSRYEQLTAFLNNELPNELIEKLNSFTCKKDATRGVVSQVLQLVSHYYPQIIGGSADLVGSTKATINESTYITKNDFSGRNIAFGVREHAMGAIGNGLALNKTLIPFTSTFFTFIDYMKPAVRLAAIMQLKHLFIFSHDSIYVGEDGPTHEPIEHLNATRLIPNLYVFRPANDRETAFSFLYFLQHQAPAVILGTRQTLSEKVFEQEPLSDKPYELFKKGAYVFSDCKGKADVLLAGSGSEVSVLVEAQAELLQENIQSKVISIPCLELFEKSDLNYQDETLTKGDIPVYFVEAASHRSFKLLYQKHIHVKDITSFGESGPYKDVVKHFHLDTHSIVRDVKQILKR